MNLIDFKNWGLIMWNPSPKSPQTYQVNRYPLTGSNGWIWFVLLYYARAQLLQKLPRKWKWTGSISKQTQVLLDGGDLSKDHIHLHNEQHLQCNVTLWGIRAWYLKNLEEKFLLNSISKQGSVMEAAGQRWIQIMSLGSFYLLWIPHAPGPTVVKAINKNQFWTPCAPRTPTQSCGITTVQGMRDWGQTLYFSMSSGIVFHNGLQHREGWSHL